MTSAPSIFRSNCRSSFPQPDVPSAGSIGKVTGLASDRYQTHTNVGGAERLSRSRPSGRRRTHAAPDLAARDALYAPYSGDRMGDRVRVHGPRWGDEPRGRPGEWRRVRREPDRLRPGGVHPGERAARECDRSGRALEHHRRLRGDASPCRGPRDQSSHALRVRRRPRIVSRRRRHDRIPRGSTKRVPRCRIAGANRSGERDGRGGVRERQPVRIAPHGPPDRRPAADALGAVSGQLGVRASGPPRRDERDARRPGSGDPRRGPAGPRGRRIPPARAARDARRDRVRPRKHRGSPVLAQAPRPGHRVGHWLARVRGDEPRSPCAGAGDRDAPESRRVPRHRGRGLRGTGRGPRPCGGDPRFGARDRRRARCCLVRSRPRSSEPGDLVASAGRSRPRSAHLRVGRGLSGPRPVPPRRRPRAHEGGRPILIGPRAFAGLLLCALLLGATWPILGALPGVPARILAGDAYLITQGSGAYSINESLVENLTLHAGVQIVSPEILSLGTVRGEPVVVRAAEPGTFLSLEGGEWVQPATLGNRSAYAGEGLVRRLGLAAGESATLVGSSVPQIAFVHIAGIYRTATPANDEMLVDFPMGRFLSGLGSTAFHSIRLRTSDPAPLLSFLREFGASVHVSGPNLPRADIASDPPTDERISNLILRSGIGGAPRDYLSTAVSEATTSVAVVAYGIAGLLGVLVAFGIHAAQARAFADRAPAVGVLRAIGAGNRWMRRRLVWESFPLALGAAVLGAGLGFLAGSWLQPKARLVPFRPEGFVSVDLSTFSFLVLAGVAVSVLSGF